MGAVIGGVHRRVNAIGLRNRLAVLPAIVRDNLILHNEKLGSFCDHECDRRGLRPTQESIDVPFHMPTGLADGLGLESAPERLFVPKPLVPTTSTDDTLGSPAPCATREASAVTT